MWYLTVRRCCGGVTGGTREGSFEAGEQVHDVGCFEDAVAVEDAYTEIALIDVLPAERVDPRQVRHAITIRPPRPNPMNLGWSPREAIVVALDFDSADRATAFRQFLENNVWSSTEASPALAQSYGGRVGCFGV